MVRYFSRVFVVEWITATSSARLHPNRHLRKSYGKNSLCNSNLADDLWRNTNSLLLRVAGKAYGTKNVDTNGEITDDKLPPKPSMAGCGLL
jgi:hypothetical protein